MTNVSSTADALASSAGRAPGDDVVRLYGPRFQRGPAEVYREIRRRHGTVAPVDRLPDMLLAVPEEDLVWRPSVWMRGLIALPVVFSPMHVARHGD